MTDRRPHDESMTAWTALAVALWRVLPHSVRREACRQLGLLDLTRVDDSVWHTDALLVRPATPDDPWVVLDPVTGVVGVAVTRDSARQVLRVARRHGTDTDV